MIDRAAMTIPIVVFCDDPFHDGKQVSVHRFMRQDRRWASEASDRSVPWSRLRGEESAIQALHGDRYLTSEQRETEMFSAPVRVRYNLECDCGVTVPARSENLYPILDMLAAANKTDISLRALAARLRH